MCETAYYDPDHVSTPEERQRAAYELGSVFGGAAAVALVAKISLAKPTPLCKLDPDVVIGQLTSSGKAGASDLVKFGESQGGTRVQTERGPIKFIDSNGIVRVTIKRGSSRVRGSAFPHVEIRNAAGQRIDPYGNPVSRTSPEKPHG